MEYCRNTQMTLTALSNVFDKYDIPKISGIKAIDPNSAKGKKIFTSADAVMVYSPVEHGVYINKSVLKNPEALAAYNKQAWNTVMENIDSLTGAQRETALRYKNAGRSLVGDGSPHDYFVHEMGHHIQWEAFDAKTNNAVGSRMSQYAGGISGYATASKSEYFVESFAAFEKGELDKLDPDFVAFLRGKSLDKSAGSGIIETEKFRRKTYASRVGVKPIRAEVYNGLVSNARRKGANVIRCEYGDEQFLHLEKNGATASCIGDTLIFRPDATISEVLEELHHYEQNLSGLNDDKDGSLRIILNEIDAKQYLLDNAKRYSIPRSETEETKLQLIQYQQKLEEYFRMG